jgi:hypothetical protein
MNFAAAFSRRIGPGLGLFLIMALSIVPGRAVLGAEGRVPDPTRAFDSAVNSAFYLDLAGARASGVWPGMADRFKRLQGLLEGLGAGSQMLPGVDLSSLGGLDRLDSAWLKELEALDFAEVLMVGEGDLSGTDLTQLGANDSFLLVARLVRPLEDQEAFIGRLLAGMDQVQTGLGNRVAATRGRVGAAELFAIPADLLAQQQMPFPISLGIGPGEHGSVLALGRTDRLERFLTGKTSGAVPAKVTALMPRRGQLWFYSAIPADASKAMAAGAPELADGLGADIFQALDRLREFGLDLSFGATAVDVQVLLGCTGSDVASQMAQQVGGMVGIMQMMGGGQVPGFLSRLRATAAGTVFTLATSVTPRDLDQLIQSAGAGAGTGAATAATAAADPGQARVIVRPMPDRSPPVNVEFLHLKPNRGGHLREGRLRIQNRSDRAVQELRLTYDYLNARGSRVGTWTRQQRDPMSNTLVRAETTRELEVHLFNVPLSTESVTVSVREVVFSDGGKWVEPR